MYLSKNKKSGIWYIYFRNENGLKTRHSTKTKYKQEANKFLMTFQEKLKSQPKSRLTFNEFKSKYLIEVSRTQSRKSYQLNKNCFDRIGVYIGDGFLDKTNVEKLKTYILDIFQTAKYSASLQYRIIKAAMNKAVYWGLLEFNPLLKFKLPKIPQKIQPYLTEQEFEVILDNTTDSMLKAILIFSFYTGCRVGEVLSMEWRDIDFGRREIKVSIKTDFIPKGKKERFIPICNKLYDILKSIYGERIKNEISMEKIFLRKDENEYTNCYVSKAFKKIVRRTNLNQTLHMHSLRHSFCSNLINKGANIYYVKELAGHSSISTTQIYSKANNESLRNSIALFDS